MSPRGVAITRRLIVVLAVFGVLLMLYGNSIRTEFEQRREIAALKAEIADAQEKRDGLRNELERWRDPKYVKQQARTRLGWVVPGETGYRVLGPDGKPVSGAKIDSTNRLPGDEHADTWWEELLGSVAAADQPAPEKRDTP